MRFPSHLAYIILKYFIINLIELIAVYQGSFTQKFKPRRCIVAACTVEQVSTDIVVAIMRTDAPATYKHQCVIDYGGGTWWTNKKKQSGVESNRSVTRNK